MIELDHFNVGEYNQNYYIWYLQANLVFDAHELG